MNEKVLVGILSCNYDKYIVEAIESVKEQMHPCSILVVDDGSTDRTLDYLKAYPDIELLAYSEKSGDELRGMQTIIDHSQEFDYTFFMSADDALYPYSIAVLLDRSKEANADWTYGGLNLVDEEGKFLTSWTYEGFPQSVKSAVPFMWATKSLPTTLCALFKGSFLSGKKMSRFPHTNFSLDASTAIDWYLSNPIIARANSQILKYRQHSLSRTNIEKHDRAVMVQDMSEKLLALFGREYGLGE